MRKSLYNWRVSTETLVEKESLLLKNQVQQR
jgi:hypothetical protein